MKSSSVNKLVVLALGILLTIGNGVERTVRAEDVTEVDGFPSRVAVAAEVTPAPTEEESASQPASAAEPLAPTNPSSSQSATPMEPTPPSSSSQSASPIQPTIPSSSSQSASPIQPNVPNQSAGQRPSNPRRNSGGQEPSASTNQSTIEQIETSSTNKSSDAKLASNKKLPATGTESSVFLPLLGVGLLIYLGYRRLEMN